MNFYFIKLGWVSNPNMFPDGEADFYTISRMLFIQPGYSLLYILMFIVLGFHLFHAFESAFQSLGLNHKTYTPVIIKVALVYSIIIPLGFIIIPVYYLIFK
jgi:succinate dehydrogenase / fumarate reductase cytochrome b subunit